MLLYSAYHCSLAVMQKRLKLLTQLLLTLQLLKLLILLLLTLLLLTQLLLLFLLLLKKLSNFSTTVNKEFEAVFLGEESSFSRCIYGCKCTVDKKMCE